MTLVQVGGLQAEQSMAKRDPTRLRCWHFMGSFLSIWRRRAKCWVAHVRPEQRPYEVIVCGSSRRIRTDAFDMHVKYDLRDLVNADTVIVPGMAM